MCCNKQHNRETIQDILGHNSTQDIYRHRLLRGFLLKYIPVCCDLWTYISARLFIIISRSVADWMRDRKMGRLITT